MTTPRDRTLSDDLLQDARAIVGRASAQAGLPTPAVKLAPRVDKPGAPKANAEYQVIHGVPTIKITETALRELPSNALESLVTHELGHLADETWWKQKRRQYLAGLSFAALLLFAGLIAAATANTSNADMTSGWAAMASGVTVAFAAYLIFQANKRAGEVRADRFAARQHGNLSSAQALFAAWDREAPEPTHRRGLRLLFRSHPYRATRLEAIEAELNRQDPPATRRT